MSIFANEFRNATQSDMELIRKFFRGYDYRGASYTFIANYIWRDSYCLSWEIIDGYFCMAGSRCESDNPEESWCFMAMPLIMSKEDASKLEALSGDTSENITSGETSKSHTSEFYRTEYEPESLRRVILECQGRFKEAGKSFNLTSIPGHMLGILREAFPGDGTLIPAEEQDPDNPNVEGEGTTEIRFHHGRDYDEYVYLKEKLIDLSGRALHKKKNHLNYFLRNFEYEVKPIREIDPEDILRLAAEIRDFKAQDEDEEEDIENEFEAIKQILDILFTPAPTELNSTGLSSELNSETISSGHASDKLRPCGSGPDDCPIYGVGIYINSKLEAFAIGEIITDTYAAEHFEKANDSFRGLYQLVCREFCKQLPESVIYVNREEDMGIPGLRQAKEALKPEHMEKRFAAEFLD